MKIAIAYGNLMERDGEKRAAFRLYVSLLPHVENSHPTMYMTVIKEIARLHHEFGTVAAAREVMSEAFRKFPSVVSSEGKVHLSYFRDSAFFLIFYFKSYSLFTQM